MYTSAEKIVLSTQIRCTFLTTRRDETALRARYLGSHRKPVTYYNTRTPRFLTDKNHTHTYTIRIIINITIL